MRFVWVVCLLALVGGLAAPAFGQTAEDASDPAGAIEVGDATVSDAEIAQRIRQVLDQIGGYDGVEIDVSSGVVTLSGEVLDGLAEEEVVQITGRVAGVVTIENELRQSGDLNERLAPALERVVERGERVLINTPIFLVALTAFLVIAAIGWLVTTRLTLWKRLAPNSFIAEIYRAVARIGFVVLGLIVALDILNATALLGAVLGAAGVVGLAVGFAVRDTVENFIASILLSLRQPFRPNDFVEIAGDMGNVARLTSRATILISPDGNHIRIPNATVFKGRIVNYSRDPKRRFLFQLGVDADSDLAAALATAVAALEALPFVLSDPPVGAWIDEVGDSNVLMTFTGWVNQEETNFVKARGEAIRVAKNALEGAGFGLPEPIYRLRVDDRGAVQDAVSQAGEAPVRATVEEIDTELPPAAAPEVVEQDNEETVDRERAAQDGSADLLSEARGSE
ncbi:MAG: mechanosensitive ion channel domain-containing protein [Pseudomonadota bacterium]